MLYIITPRMATECFLGAGSVTAVMFLFFFYVHILHLPDFISLASSRALQLRSSSTSLNCPTIPLLSALLLSHIKLKTLMSAFKRHNGYEPQFNPSLSGLQPALVLLNFPQADPPPLTSNNCRGVVLHSLFTTLCHVGSLSTNCLVPCMCHKRNNGVLWLTEQRCFCYYNDSFAYTVKRQVLTQGP